MARSCRTESPSPIEKEHCHESSTIEIRRADRAGPQEGLTPEVFDPDDNTRILQGILLEVDEALAHCPRAFMFSKLWNTESIESARADDANGYWLGCWREDMAKTTVPKIDIP